MDARRFDDLLRAWAESRRSFLWAMVAGLTTGSLADWDTVAGKKKKKKKKKRKQQPGGGGPVCAASCSGCCTGDGQCLEGGEVQSPSQCGTGGADCQQCGPDQGCEDPGRCCAQVGGACGEVPCCASILPLACRNSRCCIPNGGFCGNEPSSRCCDAEDECHVICGRKRDQACNPPDLQCHPPLTCENSFCRDPCPEPKIRCGTKCCDPDEECLGGGENEIGLCCDPTYVCRGTVQSVGFCCDPAIFTCCSTGMCCDKRFLRCVDGENLTCTSL